MVLHRREMVKHLINRSNSITTKTEKNTPAVQSITKHHFYCVAIQLKSGNLFPFHLNFSIFVI